MRKSLPETYPPKKKPYLGGTILKVSIATITVFWAVLYLPNLRTTPNWYGDETLTLQVGLSLTEGKLQNRATFCTFFSPAYNYQPGYAFLSGLASRLTKGDILGARLLAVFFGLLVSIAGFLLLRKRFGYSCSLSFSLLLLGYSQAIIHYRWVYPHSVVGLSLIGALGFINRCPCPKNDWKAGGFLALGACANLLAIHAVIASVLCRLIRPRSWIPIILPSFLVMLTTTAVVYSRFGNWVFEDLIALKEMFSRYSSENAAGMKVLNNLLFFFIQDWFHVAILLSIPFCLNRKSYKLALGGITVLFLLVKNRQNLPLFYYQALAVYPVLVAILAVGFCYFLKKVCRLVFPKGRLFFVGKSLLRCLPISLATAIGLLNLPSVIGGVLPVKILPWVVESSTDYEVAANWLNQRTSPDDLIITHWNLAWLLNAKTADVLMAAAWQGYPAGDYFPSPPSKARFAYSADLESACYFVITELDEIWTFHQGQTKLFLVSSSLNKWPLVFQAGKVKVFKNPGFK